MFTGLIEEVGTVVALRANGEANRLEIAAPRISAEINPGDSVAIFGAGALIAGWLTQALPARAWAKGEHASKESQDIAAVI